MRRALATSSTVADLLNRVGRPDLAVGDSSVAPVGPLVVEAGHEAALLRHPYVAPAHVVLSALRAVDMAAYSEEWDRMATVSVAGGKRRWPIHPLGRHSAARPGGNEELERRNQRAIVLEIHTSQLPEFQDP
ncbi:MAG: hypothetical protein ACR2MY_08635 [Candidatus Dormibacteria bacterium]